MTTTRYNRHLSWNCQVSPRRRQSQSQTRATHSNTNSNDSAVRRSIRRADTPVSSHGSNSVDRNAPQQRRPLHSNGVHINDNNNNSDSPRDPNNHHHNSNNQHSTYSVFDTDIKEDNELELERRNPATIKTSQSNNNSATQPALPQTVKCRRCDGSGEWRKSYDCKYCDKKGYQKNMCISCKGTGVCHKCEGSGKFVFQDKCKKCSGSGKYPQIGKYPCRKCDGHGVCFSNSVNRNRNCNGNRGDTAERNSLFADPESAGRFSSSPSPSLSSDVRVAVAAAAPRVRCSSCNGHGRWPLSTTQQQSCNNCSGNGIYRKVAQCHGCHPSSSASDATVGEKAGVCAKCDGRTFRARVCKGCNGNGVFDVAKECFGCNGSGNVQQQQKKKKKKSVSASANARSRWQQNLNASPSPNPNDNGNGNAGNNGTHARRGREQESLSKLKLKVERESQQKVNAMMLCSICVDQQKDRVLIPCGHTFCVVCTQKFVQPRCPLCNAQIQLTNKFYL